jgi:hypothetical protein
VVVPLKNWTVVPVPLVGTLLPSQLAELLQTDVPLVVVPVHTLWASAAREPAQATAQTARRNQSRRSLAAISEALKAVRILMTTPST